jgi:hypothetical protein
LIYSNLSKPQIKDALSNILILTSLIKEPITATDEEKNDIKDNK